MPSSDPQQQWCDDFIARFNERAEAVRNRPMPPLEGYSRKAWIQNTQQTYTDYAIIADSVASLDEGIFTIKVDLRSQGERETSVSIENNNRGNI